MCTHAKNPPKKSIVLCNLINQHCGPIKVFNRWNGILGVWGLHQLNKLLLSSRGWTHHHPLYSASHTHHHTHKHPLTPLSEVKHWTILTAGITAQSLRMWMRKGGGVRPGGKGGMTKEERKESPSCCLHCQIWWGSKAAERRGEDRREEKETRGSKTEREGKFGWQPCSLSHQIRRSSEREMSLCSQTSLLPPQTAAAGIRAHWFAARRGGGRWGRRDEGAQEATQQGWEECWRSNRLLSHLID